MGSQLITEKRETISRMLGTGQPSTQMAPARGRHGSTIYRELARNAASTGYRAVGAHRLAMVLQEQWPLVRKMDPPENLQLALKRRNRQSLATVSAS